MNTQNIGKTVVTKSGQVKKPLEQRAEEIRELAQQGFVSAQIASRLQIGEQQVRKIASDQNIVLANASMGRPRRVDMRRWLEESVMQIEASAAALGSFPYQFEDMPREDVAAWAESVGNALAVYRKFHNKLKECLHANP